MERISDRVRKELPPVRLYLDEVTELWEFVKSSAEEITFETLGYRLDSPSELAELPSKISHDLLIQAYRPYVRVHLTCVGAEIYVGGGDLTSRGIAEKCEEILTRGKLARRFLFLRNGWVSFAISAPFWVGVYARQLTLAGAGAALVVAHFGWLYFDYRFSTRRYSTIIFLRRADATSFWQRNRDNLILLIVGAVVGAAVTLIAQWLAKLTGLAA